jgi:uncharacterized glyoxalase superfamily metalloenzyme YdcJ
MKSRIINVRLDEERLRKVRALRQRGVVLSDLVREAIDQRFEEAAEARKPRDINAILDRIFEAYPDPPDLPPPEYDVHDRRAAAAAIRRKLHRKLSRR